MDEKESKIEELKENTEATKEATNEVTKAAEHEMESSKALLLTVLISIGLMIGISVISFIMFTRTSKSLNSVNGTGQIYDQYYALICENNDFYRQVYKFAKSEGDVNGVCVDMFSDRYSDEYSVADLLKIAIESNVDGIIVESDASSEIASLIDEATGKGINVVTLMTDCPDSMRRSSVQVSGYNLGRQYGSQVASSEMFFGEKVLFITDSAKQSAGEMLIFTGIQDYINEVTPNMNISMSAYAVDGSDIFVIEEMIREIFKDETLLPDVIICPDERTTASVYQALVDYNRVGEIRLLGYYDSDTILKGIKEGVIEASITVDVSQLGEYAVSALYEYNKYGYVSDYYTVDTTLINAKNIDGFLNLENE